MGVPSAVAALETGATMLSAKSTKTETQLMAEEMLRATSRLQRDVEMEFMRQSAEFGYYIWMLIFVIIVMFAAFPIGKILGVL
jgi:hypothetical protein